jgi:hypothetical protein
MSFGDDTLHPDNLEELKRKMRKGRKIAVVGSREFNNQKQLEAVLKYIFEEGDELVTGGAPGVDTWAERWAIRKGYRVKIFRPDWSLGRHAGFLRNTKIVEYADFLVAFWDGKSKGTKDTWKKGEKARIPAVMVLERGQIK